ncbi:hypothetical protein MRB53_038525 [Persea americana]|nr:hypothetical protein MRB53_038525 [Persea americana]
MTEVDLATRAPENDAQEDKEQHSEAVSSSIFPNDTPAQTGPSMGGHCTTDRPLPTATEPSGELTTLNGVDAYVSKPSDYPHAPSKLLLLLTGGTGLHSKNNQLQADAYAKRGYLVVMPDQFGGDPASSAANIATQQPQSPTGEEPSMIERIKMGIAETAKSFSIDMWLAKHTPERVLPILRKVIAGAQEAYADAVANGGGIYGVGYCFGAKYILLLCGSLPDTVAKGQKPAEATAEAGEVHIGPSLKAGAIAHGTLITKEDIESVKSPVAMVCVENDALFPDHVRKQGKASLELNAVDHDVTVFKDVPHGFAVLGQYPDKHIEESQKKAFEQMCSWLEAH